MASSKVLNPRLPQKSCLVTGDERWFWFFWASLGFCGVCNYSRSQQDGETSWWKMKKEAEWYIKDGGCICPEWCCGGWADLMGSHFELTRRTKKKVRHIFFPYIPARNIVGLHKPTSLEDEWVTLVLLWLRRCFFMKSGSHLS